MTSEPMTPATLPRVEPLARVPVVGLVLAVGCLLGLLSIGADYLLRYPWSMVGNVAATWVLVAFAVGAATGRSSTTRAALAGLGTLAIATVVYYAVMALVWPPESVPKLLPGVVVWGAVSVIVGPGVAAAGAIWRRGPDPDDERWWTRPIVVGIVGAIVAAEGAFLWSSATDADSHIGAGVVLLVAGLFPLVLLRPARERMASLATVVLVGGAAVQVLGTLIPLVFKLAGSGRL